MDFIYTVDPNSETPIMLINKHIGIDNIDGVGIIGDQFQRELLELDAMGKRRVEIWINSPGGSVMDGYSICSAILNTKCKVDTYCRGLAASIAGVIFLCGRTKYMADYGIVMMHDPYGGENNEALDKIKNSLATLIAARCGKTPETIKAIMSKETFMDASEAIDLGVCDEIEISSDTNVGRLSPLKNDAKAFWKSSMMIFNNALKDKSQPATIETNKIMDFKKINNKLGLMDEASVESTVNAIEALKNKAIESEKKVSDLEKSLVEIKDKSAKSVSDMEAELKKMKEAYEAREAELAKMKKDAEDKEVEDKKKEEEKVKNAASELIAKSVSEGRIPNEEKAVAHWTNKAIKNFEETKADIEILAINKVAPKLDDKIVDDKNIKNKKSYESVEDRDAHIKSIVAEKMEQVKNKLNIK